MHNPKARVDVDLARFRPAPEQQVFTAGDIRRFLRLRRWAILIPILLALAAAYAYNALAVPMYYARAQIVIDPRMPQFMPGHNEESVMAWDTAQVESEIAIISSERIAAAVVRKLQLDTSNDFQPWPPLLERALAFVQRREPVAPVVTDRFRTALNLIDKGLSVRRTGLSYAIDISFTYPDPLRATEIANATAQAYIADQLDNRSQAARVGGEWLQERMVTLRTQMNAAAKAVQIFRSSHNYQIPLPQPGDAAASKTEPPEAQTLDELDAAAATYRRIYESFLQSYTESVQRQSFPVSDARLLTEASLPKVKSAPRTTLIFALALLVGTLLGFGLAMLMEHLDRTVRTTRQAADATGLESLGELPHHRVRTLRRLFVVLRRLRPFRSSSDAVQATHMRHQIARQATWRRHLGGTAHFLHVLDYPRAPFGRAMSTVKVLTDLARRQRNVRVLGVTAAHRGAGSSVLASNLASLSAASGRRTLVIDADLARRTLTRHMRAADRRGFSDILAGTAVAKDVVISLPGTSLDVLPAGSATGVALGSLNAEALQTALDAFATRYDLVIVDLPPVLPVANELALAAPLDGVLFVIKAGSTSIAMATHAQSYLGRAEAPLVGFVLTNATV